MLKPVKKEKKSNFEVVEKYRKKSQIKPVFNTIQP
jgi:hypothetical protein